jgi:hypothetical protein
MKREGKIFLNSSQNNCNLLVLSPKIKKKFALFSAVLSVMKELDTVTHK